METTNDDYDSIKHFTKLNIIASLKAINNAGNKQIPTLNSDTNSILTRQENMTNASTAPWEHGNA